MDPLPPDPYLALNVARSASSSEIKTAYRKLALTCHPDKAPDKADEFHRIQQAYELIGDDASRSRYEESLRFAELKQNMYQRRGSAPGPNVDIRTAAFDVRPNSNYGAGFQARGPPRYEERRPPPSASSGVPPSFSAPRSPFAEEDKGDSYFPQRSASRKYDGFEGPSKRAPSTKSPKSAPRSEETRETLRKQKMDSAKTRNDKKKQRDQEMGRERRGKFATTSFASVESDDSDTEVPPRRRGSRQEEYYEDPQSQKYQAQSSATKEYVNRAKVEAVPLERNSPPAYPRRGSVQEIPIHSRSSDEQDSSQEYRRGSRDARPVLVRKSSSRPKERTPEPATERKPAAKDVRPKASERRPAESAHATSERHPPSLYPSVSSPSSIKTPKSRSSDEYEGGRGAPPPRLDRSSTMPASQPSPPASRQTSRKTDTAPTKSSNLRYGETNNLHQDSGYSTGTSPNDTTPVQFPSSMNYQYGADTVQVETEYESVLREPNRPMRRSPSPIRRDSQQRDRPSLGRDRDSRGAPPSARSASYTTSRNVADPEVPRRRPSLSRNSSSREGSGRVPTMPNLQRGASTPLPTPLRTGMPDSSRDLLFGEMTGSPVDFRDPFSNANANSPANPGVRRGFDSNKVNYAPRISSDDISYSYRSPPSGGSGPRLERRGSEDISKQQQYRTYMAEANGRERRAPRPGVAVG